MTYRRWLLPVVLLPAVVAGLCWFGTRPATAEYKAAISSDWANWRGPTYNGIAAPQQNVPVRWSEGENIVWKAAVPGRGHASPVVVGDLVLLPSADEQAEIQWVLAYDRASGKELWRTVVHEGKFDKRGNRKSSQASGSVACDGERIFVNFVNDGSVRATALSLEGKILWQQEVHPFATHQGFGASPCIWGDLVIFAADSRTGGAIVALDRVTGKEVWRQARPKEADRKSVV